MAASALPSGDHRGDAAAAALRQAILDRDEQLSPAERYLQQVLDAIPLAVISTDHEGIILTCNRKAEELYQYRESEVAGLPVAILIPEEQQGEDIRMKAVHRRRDGRAIPVWLQCLRVLGDEAEHIARLYVVDDLSEREHLEAQLIEAERLSLLGQLALRIAHEFKTPLQLVCGYAELARFYLDRDEREKMREALDKLESASQQMRQIIRQMNDLGQPREGKYEEVDIGAVARQTLEVLDGLGVLKRCRVRRRLADPVPPVMGDAQQLEQLLRNLVINAVQAMEGTAEKELQIAVTAAAGQVEVAVEDSGEGIAEEDLARIFDPFFTTRRERDGTGLGLAIVRAIAERHRAEIAVDSEVGRGTRVRVVFPAKEAA